MDTIIGSGDAPTTDAIKDVSVETFEEDVVAASMTTPVIVDFWAEWCGPCKQLAPQLEKAVAAAGGKVKLAKIDIDKNQMLASQLRIQSIPTVYAFYQGRPIDGFQGAVPESEIKAFVERLVAQGGAAANDADPTEDYLSAGAAAFEEGDVAAAAQLFGQVAQADPTNIPAIAGLARCQMALGEVDQAKQTIAMVPQENQTEEAITSIVAAIALAESNPGGGDISVLQARVEAEPENFEARFELAGAHLSAGAMEPAMDELLTMIEQDREWDEEAARKKLLTVFEALGPTHPATLRGRRRLSSILFS